MRSFQGSESEVLLTQIMLYLGVNLSGLEASRVSLKVVSSLANGLILPELFCVSLVFEKV